MAGVPSLPALSIGYRHMSQRQFYWYHGRLFHIPPEECEHGLFDVSRDALDATKIPDHPKGGHNYYTGKDLERVGRRMFWVNDMMEKPGWEKDYAAKVAKFERPWKDKQV